MSNSNLVERTGLLVTAAVTAASVAGCTINRYYSLPAQEPTAMPYVEVVPVCPQVQSNQAVADINIRGNRNTVIINQNGECSIRPFCPSGDVLVIPEDGKLRTEY